MPSQEKKKKKKKKRKKKERGTSTKLTFHSIMTPNLPLHPLKIAQNGPPPNKMMKFSICLKFELRWTVSQLGQK